ncbi:MAG: MFS transporter [Candidatus Rokubacteria bacterium]|nr:MFS transporter [Candidatus Rokubacteria bacterium]
MWSIPAWLFMLAFFHRPAPGVITKELMQSFDISGTVVGLLSATYFYSYAALMVPAGLFIDTFGVRRIVALGGLVMGLGAVAMAAAWSEAPLFAGRFIVGLGATVTFVGALKVAAVWFPPSRFGTLSAISAAVGVLGALLATAPWAWLVARAGWRAAFAVVAGLTFVGAVLCYAIVRDAPAGTARAEASPPFSAVLRGTVRVLANPHTWPPFVAFFFMYAAVGNMMLWFIPYLRDVYGMVTTEAALYATATSLALLAAGPLTGWLSDRVLARRKLPYLGLAVAYLGTWLVFLATLGWLPPGPLYALLFVMGAVGGGFVLTWPIAREVNPPELAGVAVAVANLGGFLGAALTQGPLGAVLDARWTGVIAQGARAYPVEAYRAAFTICAAFVLLSAVAALFVRETRGRNVYAEILASRGLALAGHGTASGERRAGSGERMPRASFWLNLSRCRLIRQSPTRGYPSSVPRDA